MPKFNFSSTYIRGLVIVEPTVFTDSRGYFMETYQSDEFAAFGLPSIYVQDNQSMSKKGTLRGLHYQKTKPQGKLVRVISGCVFDVAVDLRRDSESFGKWFGIELTAENKKQFYIPEGFAHGFLVLSEYAEFVYKCTRLYDPKDEEGLLWSDEDIGIGWPCYGVEVLLSKKDQSNKRLHEVSTADLPSNYIV